MRLNAFTFDNFEAGQTDFGNLISTVPQAKYNEFLTVMSEISVQVTVPVQNKFISIIVVGHSDRQDRSDLNCDQKRSSEIEAAQKRAISTWEWIKQRVISNAAQVGYQVDNWWETSPHVTWGLVFAAAGMLQHDPPIDEDMRKLNRRVVVLISLFNPV